MPITVNEGGVKYELGTVYANEGGVKYELDTINANEGGAKYEIHSGIPKSLTWICNSKDTSAKINTVSDGGLYIDCVTDSWVSGSYTVPSIYAKVHLAAGTIINYAQTSSATGTFILGINSTLLDQFSSTNDLEYSGQGTSGSITITTSGDYYISISASSMPSMGEKDTQLTLQFSR